MKCVMVYLRSNVAKLRETHYTTVTAAEGLEKSKDNFPKPNKPQDDAASYRSIYHLSCCLKLIERTIVARFGYTIDNVIPKEQAGYPKNRNCCDRSSVQPYELCRAWFRKRPQNRCRISRPVSGVRHSMETGIARGS